MCVVVVYLRRTNAFNIDGILNGGGLTSPRGVLDSGVTSALSGEMSRTNTFDYPNSVPEFGGDDDAIPLEALYLKPGLIRIKLANHSISPPLSGQYVWSGTINDGRVINLGQGDFIIQS